MGKHLSNYLSSDKTLHPRQLKKKTNAQIPVLHRIVNFAFTYKLINK